jgi:hypothetical protein
LPFGGSGSGNSDIGRGRAGFLALTWGGTQYSWVSPEIFALLAASFALSLAFGWRLTRERAVPAAHRAAQPGDAPPAARSRWASRSGSPSWCRFILRSCTSSP